MCNVSFPESEDFNLSGELSSYEEIFEFNPQISIFEAFNIPSRRFLRLANEKLKHLEYIRVSFHLPGILLEAENDIIHFATVKRCHLDFRYSLDSSGVNGSENIPFVFDQLEGMYITDFPLTDTYLEFIMRHKNIRSLTVLKPSVNPLTIQKLQLIVDNLLNLDDLTTFFYNHWDIDEWIDFMKRNTKLRRITLSNLYYPYIRPSPAKVRSILYRKLTEFDVDDFSGVAIIRNYQLGIEIKYSY